MKRLSTILSPLGAVLTSVMLALPSSALAATLTVTQLGDSGAGSLRAAIASANASPEADRIEFASGVDGTLTLASALPVLEGELVIAGPGVDRLTVSGGDIVRVFEISAGATVDIQRLTIAHGRALSGGGISNQGSLNLSECLLVENSAPDGLGGGIDNFGGTLEIIGCVIENNIADVGGGINNDGTLSMIESLVRGNGAVTQGGGIDNSGNTVLLGSLVTNNAAEFGGGIGNGQALTVVNSTISGNTADGAESFGGGIDNFGGEVELLHATVAANSASVGGGIASNSQFVVKNSLVVNHAGGGNCAIDAGPFQALGDNQATDGSCAGFEASSTTGVALGPLVDNGGPTLTHALGTSSVAVNAVSDCTGLDGTTPTSLDQRGVSRPQGAACDIGAFELVQPDLIFADGFE